MISVSTRKGMKMIGAVLNGHRRRAWQVFFDADGEWVANDPGDGTDATLSEASTYDILDSDPASMVQVAKIKGRRRLGIYLPGRGQFYALLG